MNDGLKDKHRQAIIDILAANSRVKRVALFGSRAMGTFTTTSDVDLALYGDELTLTDQAKIAVAIDDLPMAQRVDLLLYKSIDSDNLKEHIRKYGVEWFRQDGTVNTDPTFTEYGMIRKDFSQDLLADLCVKKIGVQTGPFGSQLHNEDYVKTGTPIITVEHLGDNRITHQSTPCVSDEDKERLSKYHLQIGDIVFSRVGSVDRRALVRGSESGWLFSGRCLRVRVDRKKIDPVYLSYFFGLKNFKQYIRSIAVGATMPSLNTKILSEVPIYYPSLVEQREIAKILSSLDDKIELNRQINQTLEQIAQAIFKSWFVDFEPVKAKIAAQENGQDPERAAIRAISGKDDAELTQLPADQLSQLAATAALFPDELVESELGMTPKGWGERRLDEILELAYGKSLKKSTREPGVVPVYGSGGINGFHNAPLVSGPGIIVGRKGTVGSIYWEDNDFFPIDTVFYVLPKKQFSLEYSFYLLQSLKLEDMNTDAAVPGLNRNNAYRLAVAAHPLGLIEKFTEIVTNMVQKKSMVKQENRTLTQLRDTLLPKLLSGKISVADTQAKIEAAL